MNYRAEVWSKVKEKSNCSVPHGFRVYYFKYCTLFYLATYRIFATHNHSFYDSFGFYLVKGVLRMGMSQSIVYGKILSIF